MGWIERGGVRREGALSFAQLEVGAVGGGVTRGRLLLLLLQLCVRGWREGRQRGPLEELLALIGVGGWLLVEMRRWREAVRGGGGLEWLLHGRMEW